MRRRLVLRAWWPLALAAIGIGVAAFGAGSLLGSTRAPRVSPVAYVESAPCSCCPAGIRLDSVEVQNRQGSTLFIVRGAWPASVDGLAADARLLAGKTEVVLKPHGIDNAFEIITATSDGAPLPDGSVASSIVHGALLVDLMPALRPPLTFEFGLWDGAGYSGRIPRQGSLAWDGRSAPRIAAGATPTAPPATVPTPTAQPSAGSIDFTSLPGACAAIPSSTPVPTYLSLTQLTSSSPMPDPRTGKPARRVTAGLSASALDVTAPFAMVAVISRAGDQAPRGQSRAIDRAGSVQLYLYSDGSTKHKAIRTFNGGTWNVVGDSAADELTFEVKATQISFYWTGLNQGDRFGFITAAPGGACAASGLDFQLQPQATAL